MCPVGLVVGDQTRASAARSCRAKKSAITARNSSGFSRCVQWLVSGEDVTAGVGGDVVDVGLPRRRGGGFVEFAGDDEHGCGDRGRRSITVQWRIVPMT